MRACARTRTPSRRRSTSSSSSSLPTNDVMSMLALAIVPPHLASHRLLMRMAVAFYVTGISTSDFHRESPPLAGTLTVFVTGWTYVMQGTDTGWDYATIAYDTGSG